MNTLFFDFYRTGLRSAADALEAQARALRELADAGSLNDAIALHTRRAGEQVERTMELWSSLCSTTGVQQPRFTDPDPVRAATASLERVREDAVGLADPARTEQRAA